MKLKILYIVPLLFVFGGLKAQEMLTLSQALELALKNNQAIEVSRNNTQIASNNHTIGNAGYLPQIGLNGAATYANNNINQRFTNGTEINQNGVGSTNLTANVILNWTIFSGLNARYVYKRLGEQETFAELQLKSDINNTLADVMAGYFNVQREQQTYAFIKYNIDIYEERLKIADTRFTIGSGAKTDLLQAKIDLNEQKSLLIRQDGLVRRAKAVLNQLLNRETNIDFTVESTIPQLEDFNYDSLRTSVFNKNIDIQRLQRNINIAGYQAKEARSLQYPWLGFTSSYNFGRSSSQAGFSLYNQNYGLGTGLTLQWNLFDGLNTRRVIKNADLLTSNTQLQLDDFKDQVDAGLTAAWYDFSSAKDQYMLEQENEILAKENVDIMLERFRLGNCTTIDLKLAQQTLQDSQNRLILAAYTVKLAETELLRLSNGLIK